MKLGLFAGYWGLGITGAEQLEMAQEADRLGYDSVWAAEAYGNDAATVLAWLASNTQEDAHRLGHLPDAGAHTGDDGDDGRHAGQHLGRPVHPRASASRAHRSSRDGTASRSTSRWRAPASTSTSCAWRSRARPSRYDGEFYKLPLPNGTGLGKPLKLIIKPVQERIPIYLAAIGPKNTALAAEIADGWLPTLFAPEHFDAFRPSLEEGAARGGPLARRSRHHAADVDGDLRRRRARAQLHASLPGALHRRHGRAREELLQQARHALRLRRRGQGDPGSVPRRASRPRRWPRSPTT